MCYCLLDSKRPGRRITCRKAVLQCCINLRLAHSLLRDRSDEKDCLPFLVCAHHEIEGFWDALVVGCVNTPNVVPGNDPRSRRAAGVDNRQPIIVYPSRLLSLLMFRGSVTLLKMRLQEPQFLVRRPSDLGEKFCGRWIAQFGRLLNGATNRGGQLGHVRRARTHVLAGRVTASVESQPAVRRPQSRLG
jgi:hypothetical protein